MVIKRNFCLGTPPTERLERDVLSGNTRPGAGGFGSSGLKRWRPVRTEIKHQHKGSGTERQTDMSVYRQTDRQADTQTGRQDADHSNQLQTRRGREYYHAQVQVSIEKIKTWLYNKQFFLIDQLTTASCCMEDGWVPGISRDLHCDQPAPRQYNAPMAGDPRNPAMSPHAVFQAHVTLLTVETGGGEGVGAERRQRIHQRCAGNWSILRLKPSRDRWNTLVQWRSALSLQYHTNTAERMYQLLFVVNFVKLHLNSTQQTGDLLLGGPHGSSWGKSASNNNPKTKKVLRLTQQ